MELLTGRTLKDVIKSEAPLDQVRTIDLGIQILRAAGFAHKRGVIHRDFKPHNVMVGPRGQRQGHGLRHRARGRVGDDRDRLDHGHGVSTCRPSRRRGTGSPPASDLYSIGVILYEMLAGRVPFEGDSAVSIALKHLSEPPPRLAYMRPDMQPGARGRRDEGAGQGPGGALRERRGVHRRARGRSRPRSPPATTAGRTPRAWSPGTFVAPPDRRRRLPPEAQPAREAAPLAVVRVGSC